MENTEFNYVWNKVKNNLLGGKDRVWIYKGKRVCVQRGTHDPEKFTDVTWFVKVIPGLVRHKSLLEIGTGSGIISLFTYLKNKNHILATDISVNAVGSARKTFSWNELPIEVRLGNLFKPLKRNERFDVIFWNHPFFYSKVEIRDVRLKTSFDYKYRSLEKFFKNAGKYLNPKGYLLLGTGNSANLKEIYRLSKKYDYSAKVVRSEVFESKNRPGIFMNALIIRFTCR